MGAATPMAGVLPLEFEMTPQLVHFGYVDVDIRRGLLARREGDEGAWAQLSLLARASGQRDADRVSAEVFALRTR